MRYSASVAPSALVVFGFAAAWAQTPPNSGLTPRRGVYLDDHYLDVLRRTHSPIAAGRDDMGANVAQMVSVSDGNEPGFGHGLVFNLVMNWHEGQWLFMLKPDGTVVRNTDWDSTEGARLEFVGREHFRLLGPSNGLANSAGPRGYTFVGAAEGDETRLLNGIALEGRYRDDNNRIYAFGSDGRAVLNGVNARFRIINEPVFERFDFVEFEGAGGIPGAKGSAVPFRREGDDLTWYTRVPCECDESHGDADFSRPLLKLHRLPTAPAEALGRQ